MNRPLNFDLQIQIMGLAVRTASEGVSPPSKINPDQSMDVFEIFREMHSAINPPQEEV